MKVKTIKTKGNPRRSLIGAIVAAIVASICCVGPLALLALGIGGAWISNLTALEPYRPIFIAITLIFLAYAFYKVYKKPKAEECESESYCANPKSERINKISLWVATFIIAALFITPYIAGSAAGNSGNEIKTTETRPEQTRNIVLSIQGMTCPSCPLTIQKSLKALDGVLQANVVFEEERAYVKYDPKKVTIEQMTNATANVGYPSTVVKEK
ncbi:MAG: hypothetical protein GXO77_08835 [Calditrichaeota bacterium]|nr:hypothetical protein [Calditrichota bacterium]